MTIDSKNKQANEKINRHDFYAFQDSIRKTSANIHSDRHNAIYNAEDISTMK